MNRFRRLSYHEQNVVKFPDYEHSLANMRKDKDFWSERFDNVAEYIRGF